MCGIIGQFGGQDVNGTRTMVTRLLHRGPDGNGLNPLANGVLGHTRLAIVDVAGGHQPIQHKTYWISFNGEIYNHAELRQRYLADHHLQTRTDTEVVLHLYAKFGANAVEMLDGMFAFAILDEDSLFLARDPIGIKPLYVGKRGDVTWFASEIKALTDVAEQVHEFPAGHWEHSQQGRQRYYRVGQPLSSSIEEVESEEQAIAAIYQSVREAVVKRLMSDVPLGVSLSGGLDSSIVAAMARQGHERLNTFAVGVEGSEDLAAARSVADFLGTRHYARVYSQQEMVDALPEVLYYLETFDPALVRSAIPNYFLAKLAAEEVKVMLTGEGADELYAGYEYLQRYAKPDDLHNELLLITEALHNTNLQRADRMSMAHSLEARVPFLDVDSIALAFGLPAAWKMRSASRPEKALLRNAFAQDLPEAIAKRPKQKFSQGAGSSHLMAQLAEASIDDKEFQRERQRLAKEWTYQLPNKEALYYYRILHDFYADEWIFNTMGHSRSL